MLTVNKGIHPLAKLTKWYTGDRLKLDYQS
jgi:hypothetical protein